VIWTVVSNDYDDSLGVGPDGRTTVANIDYVVDAALSRTGPQRNSVRRRRRFSPLDAARRSRVT